MQFLIIDYHFASINMIFKWEIFAKKIEINTGYLRTRFTLEFRITFKLRRGRDLKSGKNHFTYFVDTPFENHHFLLYKNYFTVGFLPAPKYMDFIFL